MSRSPFDELELVLLSTGYSSFGGNIIVQCLGWFLRLLYIFLYCLLITRQLNAIASVSLSNVVTRVSFLWTVSTSFVLQLMSWSRRRRVTFFRTSIESVIDIPVRSLLKRDARILLLAYVALVGSYMTCRMMHWRDVYQQSLQTFFWDSWRSFYTDDILTPLLMTTFLPLVAHTGVIMSCVIYLYHLRLLMRYEEYMFGYCDQRLQLTSQVSNQRIPENCKHRKCLLQIMKVNRYHDDFEDIFNVYPVLWFLLLFIDFQHLIRGISHEGVSHETHHVMEFFGNVFSSSAVAFAVNHFRRRMNSCRDKLLLTIMSKKDLDCGFNCIFKRELMKKLESKVTSLTGSNMFDLDAAFFLTFVNALVNMTVVFVDIKEIV